MHFFFRYCINEKCVECCGTKCICMCSTHCTIDSIIHVGLVVLVAQLCPTLCDPVDYSPPGSSVHGILQARIPEWVAIPFSRGIFRTQGSNPGLWHCRQILYHLSCQGSPCGDYWTFKNWLLYFNWRLITLHYCGCFCHTSTWISHGCTCVPHPEPPSHLLPHPIPQGHPSAPALSTLSHEWNLDWSSVSYMIIYMFQCYSLKSSHPRLLPQNPKDCSLHLCLFCCLTYRVIFPSF